MIRPTLNVQELAQILALLPEASKLARKLRAAATRAGMSITATVTTAATKEQYWQECYQRKLAGEQLTAKEEEAANEHAYLYGLMTPEELASFEAGI